jgi:hypothetical protein
MPPKMQMPPAPQVSGHHFMSAVYEIFLYIALSAAVFTRRRFGYRGIFPVKLVFAAGLFWFYHDFLFPLLAQSFEPPLLASPAALVFCIAMLALALFHWIEAYAAHHRGDERHTYFIGEPWIAAFIPSYWLSVAVDILLIAVAGYFLAYLDAALGLWLIIAAVSLAGITLRSLKQLRRDVADMRDAGVHAGLVSDRTPTPAPRPTATASPQRDGEEVSTGATRRR